MEILLGLQISNDNNKVCKLLKSLYEIKQFGRFS